MEFEGIISGDHESFCFDVTKEVFEKVTGRSPDKWDKAVFNKGLYRLYPGHILESLGLKCKCKITISGEEISDGR